MQSVAGGGVVGVLVGVGVAVGVVLPPPGDTGGVGAELGPGVWLLVESGFGVPVPGLGVTFPLPGLGSGVGGGGGLTGPGLPVGGTGGVDCELDPLA